MLKRHQGCGATLLPSSTAAPGATPSSASGSSIEGGMTLLLFARPGSNLIYIFAAFYGGGMGIKTIVQATAGPEFLGREGYGALQGTFAGMNYAVQAATPFALAVLWSVMGNYDRVLWVLFGAAALSTLAFLMALAFRPRGVLASASR